MNVEKCRLFVATASHLLVRVANNKKVGSCNHALPEQYL